MILCAAALAVAGPRAPLTVSIGSSRIDVSQPIEFENGKPALTAAGRDVLDGVVDGLIRTPSIRIQIGVHTDSLGADAANLKLSQERADAIRAYLVKRGVAPSRLEAKGFGETVPIASNVTAAGRAKNRRVELLVLGAAPAAAPPPPGTSPAPAAAPPAPRPAPPQSVPGAAQTARELYEKGERAYNVGDFAQAVQYFLGSYALVPSPALLFNIAQSYRLAGDRKLAVDYFKRFLAANPKSAAADRVRQLIAELSKP
jgi:OOP family OmpA-OmpF porin